MPEPRWLGLAAIVVLACGRGELPPVDESFPVAGLREEVDILVDEWGVAHIFAANDDDLFLAQGWNAARDRLWQLDLWKRRGEGRLAEVLGPDYLAQDRAARLLLFRGSMHDEWLAYASDTKRIAGAFARGVNAWIDVVEGEPERIPPEFAALEYRPARWTAETVARIRSHGLLRNVRSEVTRAGFLARFGAAATGARDVLEPAHELVVPEGLDVAALPEGVLGDYDLGTRAVRFGEEPADVAALSAELERWGEPVQGSNNWAISPARTATGRPLLANDPHRALAVPSLRYIVHLVSPKLDVIGAGEPALPGISIGHNRRIAFGLTVFSIDQEDLYVYAMRSGDPPEVLYRGRWEPMAEVRESVAVRAGGSEEVVLHFTRHGPVLFEDAAAGRAYALRAAWLEPGMAPYLGSIEYMRARDWDEFLAAMNRWGLPGENQVYADVDGNIGWKPGGLAPVRASWDGLLPVPGDGRYEWDGYYDMDELPVELNPARGWVATANQMNLPASYPRQLGYEWAAPYRYRRIAEVLERQDRMSVADAVRLQTDYVSLPARELQEMLHRLEPENEEQRRVIAELVEWDARLDATSEPAALAELWLARHLRPAIWHVEAAHLGLGDDAAEALSRASVRPTLRVLRELLQSDPEEARSAMLVSLVAASRELDRLLSDGERGWGALHHSLLVHPLSQRLRAAGLSPDVGPLPRGGSGDTPGSTSYRARDFRQVSGASFRMALDVGAWDESVAMNTPGQSGDPRSPHYSDLFPKWASDEAFPLVYSRERVVAASRRHLRLVPR